MTLCHQDASANGERAIGPERGHTTKHRGARLKPASTTRGGRVDPARGDRGGPARHGHGGGRCTVTKPRRYSLGCQVRRAGSRRVRSTYSWTVLPSVRHGQRRGTCGARGGRCGCTAGTSAICRRTSLGRSQSLSLGRCCLVVCARQRHGFLEQALKLHHVSKVYCECMSELLMQVSMDLYAASMW